MINRMNKRILICDDDEGIVDVVTIVLQDKNYEVLTLQGKGDVFEEIKELMPDVILLDLWMPEVSGDKIAKKLKSDESTKHIPIIVVSASRDTEKVAMDVGANDFLSKPFDILELEEIVGKHLN